MEMSTIEEIKETERENRIIEDNNVKTCMFCGKVLNDYDYDTSCKECE